MCRRSKKLLGFLYRFFGVAKPHLLAILYKSLVLPVLDYCSSVWDPQSRVHQVALKRVQSFAARVVTHNWKKDAEPLKILLKWPSLSCRRRVQKVCVCRRILSHSPLIPASSFTSASTISKSHLNSQPLFHPFVRTSHHKASFSVDIINKWNSVSEKITSLLSNNAYKLQLKNLLLLILCNFERTSCFCYFVKFFMSFLGKPL